MDIWEIIGAATVLFVVGIFIWAGIKLAILWNRFLHPELRPPKGGKKDHDNYNLDVRRFTLEKLKRPIWLKWLAGGLIASFVPLIFVLGEPIETKIGVVLGFMISWLLLMIAVSGVIMTGANAPSSDFLQRNGLKNLPGSQVPVEIHRYFTWAKLFSDAIIPQVKYMVYGERMLKVSHIAARWWVFRYRFEFKPSKLVSQELYELSIFAVQLSQNLPNLVIDGGDVYDFKHFIPSNTREKISLEGSFGTNYTLFVPTANTSENRLLALSMMTPDVMKIYEDFFDKSCMIIENNTVLVLTRRDIYEKNNYELFYQGIDQIVDKMLREAGIRSNVGQLLKS